LQVRNRGGAAFKRGEEALIVDYDQEHDTYLIEPMQALLPEPAADEQMTRGRPTAAAAQLQQRADKNKG
jgi:hypothetical protein